MKIRRFGFAALGTLLALTLSTVAYAQAVLQSVTVRVEPGQMDSYLGSVAKLQGVMDRVGGGGRVAVWQATLAGAGSRNTLVGVSYPSLEAYADVSDKTRADAEWQKIMSGLDEVRTLLSTSLLVSADGGGQVAAPEAGSVLQGVIVRVNPGKLDDYLAKLASLRKVQERIGSSGEMRVWRVTLGGETAGSVAVGIVYPNLKAYAADSGKLQADAEGQKIFASLDGIRSVVSSSLFVSP